MCGLCPLEAHHLPGGETCLPVSMLSVLGTDLDTGLENRPCSQTGWCCVLAG